VAATAVISVGALGGIVQQGWGSVFGSRAHRAALIPGPGLTPFVLSLYNVMEGAQFQGYHLPGIAPSEMKTIGQWELTFHGDDPNEAENVALCVRELDGVVIPAGAVFSYNDTVGERTEDRGFRPGLMYVAGQVVTGLGGGVCIPSTALYNAALNADMEIIERHNHSGPVSYATPGLDAAVVFGAKDLRFRNTSDEPVVLHANVLGNTLSIGITGKPAPGRRVTVERTDLSSIPFDEVRTPDPTVPRGEPQVKQAGRAGWNVTVVRTVYQGSKVLRREIISRDTVAPRERAVLVNPLDDPASPEALAAAESVLAASDSASPVMGPPTPAVVPPAGTEKAETAPSRREPPKPAAVTESPAKPEAKLPATAPHASKAEPAPAAAAPRPAKPSTDIVKPAHPAVLDAPRPHAAPPGADGLVPPHAPGTATPRTDKASETATPHSGS
jgi:hypothetical protein